MRNKHRNGSFNSRMYACGKYRFRDYGRSRNKSGAKYRCEYIPLFSLAPSCSCALITQIRECGIRTCVLPLTGGDHRAVRNIAHASRAYGRKCNTHPRLRRKRQAHISLTCGLSERNFRQSAPIWTFGIVYGLPIITFCRSLSARLVLSNGHVRY